MLCLQLPTTPVKSLSHVCLFAIPWTVAYQAPLSVGFSRQLHLESVKTVRIKKVIKYMEGVMLCKFNAENTEN